MPIKLSYADRSCRQISNLPFLYDWTVVENAHSVATAPRGRDMWLLVVIRSDCSVTRASIYSPQRIVKEIPQDMDRESETGSDGGCGH